MATTSTGHQATKSFARGEYSADDDGPADERAINHRYLSYVDRYVVPILRRRAGKRLASTIGAFRHELKGRPNSEVFGTVLPKIHRALDSATKALEAGDLDGGWKYLQSAQRLELLCLETAELNAVAIAMRIEADKLNPWRKKAVTELLNLGDGQDREGIRVFRAALLRDEHYNNEAHKDGIRRATTLWLALSLFIGLMLLLVLAWTGRLYQVIQVPATDTGADLFDSLLGMAVTGLLGATVSAITSNSRLDGHTRIPEIIYSFRGTVMRLLVGPVSAIILYFAVHSNLYSSVLNFAPDGYALLVLAFAAGFTERLVLSVVEAVAGKGS